MAVCADTVNTSNVNDKKTKDDIFVYNKDLENILLSYSFNNKEVSRKG